MYCKNYKQAPIQETHGLLRKAMRLDKILEQQAQQQPPPAPRTNGAGGPTLVTSLDGTTAFADLNGAANGGGPAHLNGLAPPLDGVQQVPDPHCFRCHTEYSPFFHEVPLTNGAAPVTNGAGKGKGVGAGKARSWLCHKCYAETRKTSYPVMIGIGAS